MKLSRADWFCLSILLAGFLLSAGVYSSLPEQIAIHWDASGRANGFGSRAMGAFGLPILTVLVSAVTFAVTRIVGRDASQLRALSILQCSITLFMFGTHAFILAVALGATLPVQAFVLPAVGALLVVIGNYLSKVHQNAWVGLRTPWTLTNDEVWLRTHRLAGRLFVGSGIITMLASLLDHAGHVVLLASLLSTLLISTGYSYLLHRRLH